MNSLRTRLLLGVLGCALMTALPGHAQGGGRPGGGGGAPGGGTQGGGGQGNAGSAGASGGVGSQSGMQPGMGSGGFNNGGRGGIPPSAGSGRGPSAGISSEGGGAMATGPVGRWWDDRHYSGALGLRPDQKRRMDAIFNGNRGELTEKVQTLRQEESKLDAATRDTRLSQESIFGQMDRVAQARDALEKVNARLMESLKKELDQDQASRIQTLK